MRWMPLLVVLVGCNARLDHDKIVKTIKDELVAKGIADATLDCPEIERARKGLQFSCGGTAHGRPFKINVEITDDVGTVSWKLVGKIAEPAKLGTFVAGEVTKQLGKPVQVTCPDTHLILEPGDSLDCDLTGEGEHHAITITLAANGDDIKWEIGKAK
jgi:hypothetical protein